MNTLSAAERYPIVKRRIERRAEEVCSEIAEIRELIEYYDDKNMSTVALVRQLEVLEAQARGITQLLA